MMEPQIQGQSQPQTVFISISADGTALELGAARETQTTAFAVTLELLPFQANLDTFVMFFSN